jgi:DNA-binding CsgD family transcriptional regulator
VSCNHHKIQIVFICHIMLGVCLLFGNFSFSQSLSNIGKPDIIGFTKDVYKGQHQNWSIAQDSLTKFVYFANSKGLLEYDGSNWNLFELPMKQKVRSVAIAPNGDIYTGALGEFGVWKPDSKGVLTYQTLINLVPEKSINSEEIWHILVTRKGILFQSFAFIYFYNPQNKVITKLKNPSTMLFTHEVNGRFFLEIIDKGLYEIINSEFVLVTGSEFLGKERVVAIMPLPDLPNQPKSNKMLIGTNKNLYEYDNNSFKIFNTNINNFIQNNQLNKGFYLGNGLYVLGSIQNGLLICNQRGRILQHINQKNGLLNNTVLSLTQDNQKNLWVGLDKGISLIKLGSPISYFQDFEGKFGTVYDAALFKNKLYLGTNQGIYFADISTANTNFTLLPKSQGQVWDLEVIDNELFCGHNNGTFKIDGNNFNQISTITGGWVIKKSIKYPELLIQGTYTKLCIYKKNEKNIWEFAYALEGFSGPVKQLEEDEKGNFWVNNESTGIQKLTLSADLKSVIKIEQLKQFGVNESAKNLAKLGNNIMINGSNGLLQLNSKTNKFELSSYQNQQKSDIIHKIFPFKNNLLLLNKSGSLLTLNSKNSIESIKLKTGQWVDDYENVVEIDQNNYLVCIENGFIILPKNNLNSDIENIVSSPLIKNISVSDEQNIGQTFRTVGNLQPIEFGANQNNISITFATPNFGNDTKYSYWLENSTKNWSPYLPISQKDFNGLSSGKYIFHLKSNNSEVETMLEIEISSPWYWNIWSKLFYFSLLLLAIFGVHKYQQNRALAEQEKLRIRLEAQLEKEKEENQKKLITLKNEQLESDIITKSEELANSTMSLVKKNELLAKMKTILVEQKNENKNDISNKNYHNLLNLVESNISTKQDWHLFEKNFNKVHEAFLNGLIESYPTLSPSDLKLAAYLRMNLSTKEIAHLLNITFRSVELKRYRLRKKMNLDTDTNLSEFMIKFEANSSKLSYN